MRTLASRVALNQTIALATLTATPARAAGNIIDRQGFESVSFHFYVGAGGITFDGTNYLGLLIEESDDNVTWTPIASSNAVNAGPGVTTAVDASGRVGLIQSAKGAADTYPLSRKWDYVGSKRYVSARPAFVGTHATGTPVAVIAVLGDPANLPVT
ncbi:MAG: hypothetical protein CGW95_01180 [Phenylobacterium zucineum]|nr:MAG: hypothetical protein CGW95_01180 [Phenylobacterium zucineum]